MGLVVWFSSHRRRFSGIAFFGLLLVVTLLGRPLWRDANSAAMSEPDWQHLSGEIDEIRFPSIDLTDLYYESREDSEFSKEREFMTLGVVKRLPELDLEGHFILMRMLMVCCVADALAVGFRVPYEKVSDLKDGDWMMVCGNLAKSEMQLQTPQFRFGTAMFSSVSEIYLIEPEKVLPYDRTARLPTLAEELDSDRLGLFREALQSCGLLEMLEGDGPFTVFAPVDEAMDLVSTERRAEQIEWLSDHIVNGKYMEKDLFEPDSIRTITDRELQVRIVNGKIQIEDVRLLFSNKEARNGVIHIVYPAIKHFQ